ncbi:SGNH/GDSL hydrolase family protein [Terrimonas sp. NA20]|uniref:SGNH/GDSL hydrolase family protein n=1 Tax=Terrimonas ginsenosidimutans TaxID=2908004 RepID=A0ABS9KSE4_9BACT|nr:SGNH/GDSL hydrolase family protein [Terrimonas ginsenosidimutans]MCG2615239.1 SGNH/GDSL hydrolase family protein [Terrimonas ginsenosidimutans]
MRTKIILTLFFLCCCACSQAQQVKHRKIQKVLILGNSIVAHDPSPAIGWNASWGMAASVADSDFVSILTKHIHLERKKAVVKRQNISVFENFYPTYDLTQLKPFREMKPDLLIIKIAENVKDSSAVSNDFAGYYKKLIDYLDPENKAIKVLVDGFWTNHHVNGIVKDLAKDRGYDFVSIAGLSADKTNMAIGQFEHEGVASHPSDKGMRLIAEAIWNTIDKYF